MIAQRVNAPIEFDARSHEYRMHGRRVPSVTQVLDQLNDWSKIDPFTLAMKAADGRDVHAACNLLVREQLDWSSLPKHIADYVTGAAAFLDEFGGVVRASEQIVGTDLLWCAGTLDLLIERNDWLYFIDWKICETVPSTVGPQLAGYEVLYHCQRDPQYRPWHPRPKSKRICVRLRPGTYAVDRQVDFQGDYATFLSCLNNWKHREAKYG